MKYLIKPFRFFLAILIFTLKISFLIFLCILVFIWEFSFKSEHYKDAYHEVFDTFCNVDSYTSDEYYSTFWDFVIDKKTIEKRTI